MKKQLSILTVAALFASSFMGCAQTEVQDGNASDASDANTQAAEQSNGQLSDQNSEEPEKTSAQSWEGEADHIIVTYLTLGTTPADLTLVTNAVNEQTIPEIGVEVEFKPVSAFDAMSQFPTWLATGETIDLMMPLMQDINTYVNQGLIEPLDDLISENAPYIKQLTEEGYTFASNNTINGSIYAITTIPNVSGIGGSFLIKEKYLEEAGFQMDPQKVYTLDDLTDLFAQIKALHPDMYPAGVVTTGRSDTEFSYASGIYDSLGNKAFTGVLMGTDGTTVTNIFETEEYKDYLEHLREWFLAGYIHPDAATTDSSIESMLNAGVSSGYFMVSAPIQKDEGEAQIRLTDVRLGSQGAGGWVIPITSEEPEAAMRFLNKVWEDSELANLTQWGIEGKHYKILDDSIGLIGFADGIDAGTSGYYNTLGLYGDTRKLYVWNAGQNQAENDAYTQEAMANPTQGVGMIYNPSEVMTAKITAIQAVVAQYLPALEAGSVDLDTYYPEFINALKAAGIDEVIADKQAQFDQWRENK